MQNSSMSGSETGRDAGGDHFKEYRGPVVEPQRRSAAHGQRAKAGGAPNDHRSHPALRPGRGDHPLLGRNPLNHEVQIGPVPWAGKRRGRAADHDFNGFGATPAISTRRQRSLSETPACLWTPVRRDSRACTTPAIACHAGRSCGGSGRHAGRSSAESATDTSSRASGWLLHW